MIWKRNGVTREVLLTTRYAIKLPKLTGGWSFFLRGLLANMQERRCGAARWPELCPVVCSMPGGWILVMRRTEPLTDERWKEFRRELIGDEIDATDYRRGFIKPWNDESATYVVPVDVRRDSFGLLDGSIVAVDYAYGA
jgi:hypothetical protein